MSSIERFPWRRAGSGVCQGDFFFVILTKKGRVRFDQEIEEKL